MDAKEFRIGNITNFGVVCEIGEDYFRVKDKENVQFKSKWADIKPIPLTEEWLLKFGFEKKGSLFVLEFDKKIMAISMIDKSYGLYNNQYCFQIGNSYNAGKHRIMYVHQLQNIYFALTNKELELCN